MGNIQSLLCSKYSNDQNHTTYDAVDAGQGTNHLNINDALRRQSTAAKFAITSTQDRDSKEYNMTHKHRGLAIIFNHLEFESNHTDRIGTDKDVERLKETLPALGFSPDHIIVHDDLLYDEMQQKILLLTTEDELLENSDCLLVIILTHGGENNSLYARRGDYDLYDFIKMFTPAKLKSLATKPKLFLIQACRGSSTDSGVTIQQTQMLQQRMMDQTDSIHIPEPYTHPNFADLLIAFSSHHSHYSFRNSEGSWFIQELCNSIDEANLLLDDLSSILVETNSKVAQRVSASERSNLNEKKQISCYTSTLIKKIYFKPK